MFKCEKCSKEYTRKYNLKNHLKKNTCMIFNEKKIVINGITKFNCKYCGNN